MLPICDRGLNRRTPGSRETMSLHDVVTAVCQSLRAAQRATGGSMARGSSRLRLSRAMDLIQMQHEDSLRRRNRSHYRRRAWESWWRQRAVRSPSCGRKSFRPILVRAAG